MPSSALISAAVAVTPSRMFSSAAVAVTPSRMFSSAAVEVTSTEFRVSAGISTVPVNVGDAVFDLEFTATAIALYSASCSAPLTIFAGLPEVRLSFAVKFVVLV